VTDRERLIASIAAQKVRPGDAVVSLEEFFIGNNDLGSIGCNLGRGHPGIAAFYDTLQAIRSRPGVQDVLVRVCEYDSPSSWPFSDTAYVLSSATLDEVQRWTATLQPSEVYAEWMYGSPPKAPSLVGLTAP
jgi:hypothetical protein